MHVHVSMCIHVCTGTHVHICICAWRQEDNLVLCSLFQQTRFLLCLELADEARLPTQWAPGSCLSFLPHCRCQACCTMGLRHWTKVLMLERQAIYWLKLSQCTSVLSTDSPLLEHPRTNPLQMPKGDYIFLFLKITLKSIVINPFHGWGNWGRFFPLSSSVL